MSFILAFKGPALAKARQATQLGDVRIVKAHDADDQQNPRGTRPYADQELSERGATVHTPR